MHNTIKLFTIKYVEGCFKNDKTVEENLYSVKALGPLEEHTSTCNWRLFKNTLQRNQ